MARFYGEVGFSDGMVESSPGVWTEQISTRNYYGSITVNNMSWKITENLNDDLVTTNRISIVGDRYLNEHLAKLRYVVWEGAKWTIKSWEIQRPRLILTLGGVYNASEDGVSDDS